MKITLTLLNNDGKPMLVIEFKDYAELRQYLTRRKSVTKFKVERVHESEIPAMRAACVGLGLFIGGGWRKLDRDEIIIDGDQWWSSAVGKWEITRCIGGVPAPTTTYRRRHAGEGYRLLDIGEKLRSGDEYIADDINDWFPTALLGQRVPPLQGVAYRRKVAQLEWPSDCTLLKADDTMQQGDLFFNGKDWSPIITVGSPVGGGEGYFVRPVVVTDYQQDEQPVKLELATITN
jgi:hypothetical protein